MTKTTKKQTDEVEFDVMVADESHEKYVDIILDTIEIAARKRGSGIARRTHEYVAQKMREGKVIIALAGDEFAGFSYIESWGYLRPGRRDVIAAGALVWSEVIARVVEATAARGHRLTCTVTSLHDILDGIALSLVRPVGDPADGPR